jgi:hypothetical protein
MQYTVKAIETRYNHVVFRSRLEAKWAAMFDLLGWQWTYEPTDFNGWLPDFAIWGNKLVYVEVKPVVEFPQDVADKIDGSGCVDEVLIVGIRGPATNGEYYGTNPTFGWLRERCEATQDDITQEIRYGWDWGAAVLGRWTEKLSTEKHTLNQIGFCHEVQSYRDRITGRYDGGCAGRGDMPDEEADLLWREAGNRVQWKPK